MKWEGEKEKEVWRNGREKEIYVKEKETQLYGRVHTSSTGSGSSDIHGDRDLIFSRLSYNQCHSPIIFIHSVACWVKLNLHHCGGRKSDMMLKALYNYH